MATKKTIGGGLLQSRDNVKDDISFLDIFKNKTAILDMSV